MIIIITGTPCTGKTSLAKLIVKQLKFKRLDVNKVIRENNLLEENNEVDEKKLAKVLEKIIKKEDNLVIDSHLAHYINPKCVDLCIVTTCNLRTLNQRLKKRRYSKEKIENNMECEIMEVCKTDALAQGHKVITLNPTKKEEVKKIIKIIQSY